jgi:hypothetical protein
MYKVIIYTKFLRRKIVKKFDDVKTASEFARTHNGILVG